MTAIRACPSVLAGFDWKRALAVSAALALHAAALLRMLAPPEAAATMERPEPAPPLAAQVVESPPPVPVQPVPPLAPPRPPVRTLRSRPPLPVPTPTPAPAASDPVSPDPLPEPADTGPVPEPDALPASGSPALTTALAYRFRTDVPYPIAAKRQHAQGTVLLRVLIDAHGVPERIEIEKSSGHAALDRSAREAVLRWRFAPAMRDGKAQPTWGLVPIAFRLDEL